MFLGGPDSLELPDQLQEERNEAMSSILRRLRRALPVLIAAAPGVIEAVLQVRQALRNPSRPADEPVAP
jgi:uncharacterized protein YbaP (TraB family)